MASSAKDIQLRELNDLHNAVDLYNLYRGNKGMKLRYLQ